MRPIKLTMQAFGPFLSETVDFDAFGDNLFLISGATGSGKTTIFDGICYALYGEASGDDRLPDGMKSDFAPMGTACVVTLVFEVHGKKYRIERLPHQQMFNSHNTGIKEQKHEAELWEISNNDSEKLLCSNITDVKLKIHEILGLTSSQFRQIVMLPQGRFSRLLKASEKERIDLLKTLFPMTFYKDFEKKLEGETRDAESDLKAIIDQIERKRDDFIAEESSPLAKDLSEKTTPVTDVLSAATAQNDEDKKKVSRLKKAIVEENKNLDLLNMAIGAAEAQIARFDKMNALSEKFTALKAQGSAMQEIEKSVNMAKSVQKVVPFEKNFIHERNRAKNDAAQLESAKEKDQACRNRWEALQPEINIVNSGAFVKALDKNRKRVEKIKDQQKALGEMAAHSEKRSRLNAEAQALKSKVDKLTDAETAHQTITENFISLTEHIAEAEKQKNDVNRRILILKQTNKSATAIAKALSRYAACRESAIDTQNQITQLQEKIQGTKAALEQARAIEQENHAAALAAELKDGEACPVCGSIHHPRPAAKATKDGEREDVGGLSEHLTQLTAELKSAQTEEAMTRREAMDHLGNAARELDEACKADGEFSEAAPADILQYDAASAHKALDYRRNMLSLEAKEIANSLDGYDKQKKEMDARLAEIKQMIASGAGLRAQFEAKTAEYEKEYGICHSIAERLSNTDLDISTPKKLKAAQQEMSAQLAAAVRAVKDAESKQKSIAETVTDTKSELSAAQANLSAANLKFKESEKAAKQAEEAFSGALLQVGLTREQYAAGTQLDGEALENHQKHLEDYRRDCHHTEDNLASLKEELAGKTKPDLEDLENRKAKVLAETEKINQDLKSTENRLNTNRQAVSDLKDLFKQSQKAKSRFGVLNGLNKTVKGTVPGKQKMSFERYILSAYLSDVLERANLFLEMISDRRYRLGLSESTEGRQSRGLSIAVYDEYTGKARNASSLSGGETFMAALSMALGLSDIVSEQNGALTIDTLFIDEGFATLDAEAREKAMTCLARLRRKGRSVGIISHVSELIDLIDDKIIVTKTDEGSHIQVIK